MRNLLAVVVMILSLYVMPAQAMRCNGKLIVKGDKMQKVLQICGDPDDISHYEINTEQPAYYNHTHDEYCTHPHTYLLPITIEVWTYNLGTGRFIRELHFKDNRIMSIERF